MRCSALEGREETRGLFVRIGNWRTRKRTFSSVNLRDFESILIFFSEGEIEELQAAIDKRKGLAVDEESSPRLAKHSDYSVNGVEGILPEVPLQHPA